ncbi:MAG: glycoside hydrolase family 113 [Mycobacteriales bacterium]
MRSRTGLAAAAALLLATLAGTASAGGVLPRRSAAGAVALPAGLSAGAAPADAHVRRKPLLPRAAAALGPSGELRGMTLNGFQLSDRALEASVADLPRMAAEGVNSVAVYVYLTLSDPAGNVVTTGNRTPSDAELQLVAQTAHALGMGVQLMPVLTDTATNSWRGNYHPSDLRAFWASYTTAVLRYADLAQSLGVQLLYVGSEQRSLETQTGLWTSLIGQVRRHYSGALSYMAIPSSAHNVRFFGLLDLAAVSPYLPLGTDAEPTYERDVAAWTQAHVPLITKIAAMVRVPLVYGEMGYNSQKGAFTRPEVASSPTGTPAPAAQADAYRALLDVLARTPQVYGVTWYHWRSTTTVADTGYSPAGKPAECVLAAHWSPYPEVRSLAALPVCDLHALDAELASLPPL